MRIMFKRALRILTEILLQNPKKILNSIKENGVEANKDLIQLDARESAEAVCYDIYKYYKNSPDSLKPIEKSILDVQW